MMYSTDPKSKTATSSARPKKFGRKTGTDGSRSGCPAQHKLRGRIQNRPWPLDADRTCNSGSASLYDENGIRYDPDEPIADLTHCDEENDEDDSSALFLHFFKDSLPPWQ